MNDYPQWQQRRRDFRSAAAHDDSGMWNFMFSLGIEMDAQADCPGRLARTLASLRQQSFRNIEILVLGGGGSGTSLAPAWIASFMSFRGLFHEPALTAVDLLNQPAADRRWRGDYLMSIPAGATVDADAFACLNRAINAAAATALPDLVLCDYDQLNPDGQCSAPVFSPGWDPDFLLAQDYLGPAFLVARDLLSRHRCQAGACGSLWEWLKSLALPGVPLATCHVCEPLLHLPAPGPAGLAVPPATIAHPLPEPLPGIAVIIPCKDHPELLERCLDFLRFETRIPLEIVIVDNASTNARTLALYAELQERHQAKIVTMDAPFNFSRMINFGVAASSSAVLLLLNNDVEISRPGTLEQLLAQACRPEVGMVGSKLLYPDGTVQHAGTLLGAGGESETRQDHYYIARHVMRGAEGDAPGYLGNLQTIRNYQAVTGALLLLRRQVFEQIGGFNEIELPVEYNDIDYCLRVRQAGYRVVCLPIAGVYHREAATRTLENPPETVAMRHRAVAYMKSRWLDAFEVDPYDNPRIHLGDSAKPSLGSPWSR